MSQRPPKGEGYVEVRELRRDEILPALHLIWDVFIRDVAPSYTPEGIEEFQKTIRYETVLSMYMNREITMFGAFEGTELIVTISVKNVGHIFLFYVKGACQGRGAGRQLFTTVWRHCTQMLKVSRITVNAAPEAVPKYIRMGMYPVMPEQTIKGMRYTPMEMIVSPCADYQYAASMDRKPTDNTLKIVLIGAAVLAAAFVTVFLISAVVFFIVSDRGDRMEDYRRYDNYGGGYYDDYYGGYYNDGGAEEEQGGLDAIPAAIEENLSYELEEETYSFTDYEKQNTYIEFYVQYPRLNGMEEKTQDKVNQILEEYAMKSVEEIYLHPSDEMKETVIGAQYPMLASYVQYKVCFASEDFLSVAYDDYNYRGSMEEFHENFRTVNINLEDGTVYQVKDVIDISDSFVEMWLRRIREDAAGEPIFSELSRRDIKRTFAGDSLGGIYVVNFFFAGNGFNIGYDLNYDENDPNDLGYVWLTASFKKNEVEGYMVDKEMWE